MTPLLGLLLIVISAAAGILLLLGIERWLHQPGLAHLCIAVILVITAVFGLRDGQRLVPLLFFLQAPFLLYFAWFRRSRSRAA